MLTTELPLLEVSHSNSCQCFQLHNEDDPAETSPAEETSICSQADADSNPVAMASDSEVQPPSYSSLALGATATPGMFTKVFTIPDMFNVATVMRPGPLSVKYIYKFGIKCFYSFLTNRIRQVKDNRTLSETTYCNIGVQKGCVVSPTLFTLHSNNCRIVQPNNYILKCAIDTAILGLLHKDMDPSVY